MRFIAFLLSMVGLDVAVAHPVYGPRKPSSAASWWRHPQHLVFTEFKAQRFETPDGSRYLSHNPVGHRAFMEYVAAFRTYTWDEDVACLAARFFAACPSARRVVLADETRGPLGIEGYEVVSHTEDTSHLDLLVHPQNGSLWFNVDYGIYILRNALPGYDYYLLSESDLAVNLSLDPIVATIADRQVDIVIHDVKPSTPGWMWHSNGLAAFAQPWRSLLFFMIVSARACDILLRARQQLAREFLDARLTDWTFCEPFVPSVLKNADMVFAEIAEFADTTNLDYRPRICLDDPRANKPGSLVHSVLGRRSFLKAVIQESDPRDWFFKDSDLHITLTPYPLSEYAQHLWDAFRRLQDHASLQKFRLLAQHSNLELTPLADHDDLAYCKPALSSSTCEFSHFRDARIDAAGANGEFVHTDYGFHTDAEDQPWWMVDMLDMFEVHAVSIVARPRFAYRFVNFEIQTSASDQDWTVRFVKLDLDEISTDIEQPWSHGFAKPIAARFIRIRLLGRGVLHLRRVAVHGRPFDPAPR